jgi:hypothetical protein
MEKNTGRKKKIIATNDMSQHAPRVLRLFFFGGREGGLDFVVPMGSNMFLKFPMCSPTFSQ